MKSNKKFARQVQFAYNAYRSLETNLKKIGILLSIIWAALGATPIWAFAEGLLYLDRKSIAVFKTNA